MLPGMPRRNVTVTCLLSFGTPIDVKSRLAALRMVARPKLQLSAEKTWIAEAESGFDFLGVHFVRKPTRRRGTKVFCYRFPATKAMSHVRQRVREELSSDGRRPLTEVIKPDFRFVCEPLIADFHQGQEGVMKLLKQAEYMAATGFTFHPTIAFRSGLGPDKAQGSSRPSDGQIFRSNDH